MRNNSKLYLLMDTKIVQRFPLFKSVDDKLEETFHSFTLNNLTLNDCIELLMFTFELITNLSYVLFCSDSGFKTSQYSYGLTPS